MSLRVSKLFVEGLFCLPRNFWYRRLRRRRERPGVTIFCRKFLVSHYQKHFVDEPLCVSECLAYRKIFLIKNWGSTIFCWLFFNSYSAETFRRRNLLSSKKFLVSKTNGEKREGGCDDYRSKIFGLTVPKHFVEQLSCVSETFWYRKISKLRGKGAWHDFTSKCFCLTQPKQCVK